MAPRDITVLSCRRITLWETLETNQQKGKIKTDVLTPRLVEFTLGIQIATARMFDRLPHKLTSNAAGMQRTMTVQYSAVQHVAI